MLNAHSSAVNSVSIFDTYVVSASGDRSIRLWDANTGTLLRTFLNHHTRGYVVSLCMRKYCPTHFLNSSIASVDFSPPAVLSGSSDKHVRLFDMTTLQGWSTIPKDDTPTGNCHVLPFSFPSSLGTVPTSTSSTISRSTACNSDSSHQDGIPPSLACQNCGSNRIESRMNRQAGNCAHGDLVRTVTLKQDFVLSGSYDSSIKVRSMLFLEQKRCH